MYISLDWVNELIGIKKIKLDELIEKLTLGGFEVEDIFEITMSVLLFSRFFLQWTLSPTQHQLHWLSF